MSCPWLLLLHLITAMSLSLALSLRAPTPHHLACRQLLVRKAPLRLFSSVRTIDLLRQRVQHGLDVAFGPGYGEVDPMVTKGREGVADYQCNVAMPLAKKLTRTPR